MKHEIKMPMRIGKGTIRIEVIDIREAFCRLLITADDEVGERALQEAIIARELDSITITDIWLPLVKVEPKIVTVEDDVSLPAREDEE